MKTIIITKKHIIFIVSFIVLLIIGVSAFWFTGISEKRKEAEEKQQEITKTEKELMNLRKTTVKLSKKKKLLDSPIVNDLPKFTKGIQIKDYLTTLEEKITNNSIILKNITAEDTLLFSSPSDKTKQVYSSEVTLNISSTEKNELFAFIKAVENDQRFIKITGFDYNFSTEESEANIIEASLLFNLYYLQVTDDGI